jgi:endonuclease V-like protein UPF0215 family
VAVDVHYLGSGAARAAAVVAADLTAAGMPRADAAELVRLMAGRFRVPDALRRADQLARTGPTAGHHS